MHTLQTLAIPVFSRTQQARPTVRFSGNPADLELSQNPLVRELFNLESRLKTFDLSLNVDSRRFGGPMTYRQEERVQAASDHVRSELSVLQSLIRLAPADELVDFYRVIKQTNTSFNQGPLAEACQKRAQALKLDLAREVANLKRREKQTALSQSLRDRLAKLPPEHRQQVEVDFKPLEAGENHDCLKVLKRKLRRVKIEQYPILKWLNRLGLYRP